MRPSDFKKPLDFMKPFAILLALFSMPLYANPIQQSLYSQKDSITLVYESRYLTNQATKLIKNGDTRAAAALLLRALPENFQNPDRPAVNEPLHKLYDIFYNKDIQEEILINGFTGSSSAFSPDNKYVLSVNGHQVFLWDTGSGTKFATLTNNTQITSADISPSSGAIYLSDKDGVINKLDFIKGSVDQLPFKHRSTADFIKVSPDGKKIITVGDAVAQIWNLESGSPEGDLILDVKRADFSPTGNKLLVVSTTNKVSEIDLSTGSRKNLYNILQAAVAIYSKCGNYIAVAPFLANKLVMVYDAEGEKTLARRLVNERVTNISFGNDVQKIYVHTINKLRTVGGVPEVSNMIHTGQLLDVKISMDNKYVATASHDHFARIWDAATGKLLVSPLKHKEKNVAQVNFSPCGNWLISIGRDSDKLYVWDVRTGKRLPMEFSVPGEKITSAEFSPCGKYIITGTHLLTAYVWNFKDGTQAFPELFHNSSVTSVKFSRDGKYVLTSSRAGYVRLWDISGWNGEPKVKVAALMRHNASASNAIFSPDNKLIFSYSVDSTAKVMDVATGKQIGKDLRHKGMIFGGVFSSNSKMIATFSNDSTVVVWDARSGNPVMGPLKHKWFTGGAAFFDDDRYLAVACWDGGIYSYEISTGEQVLPAMKHNKRVQHLEIAPNGKFLVSGSLDLTSRIWKIISPDSLLKKTADAVVSVKEPAKELLISDSGDRDLAKSHWLASEAEISLMDKDTLKAVSLLLEALPSNIRNPEKSYANEAVQLLADIYNSSYGKMRELGYSNVSVADYSPCGKYIYAGTNEGYLYILDSGTQALVQVFDLGGKINDVKISGDSKTVATICNLNEIKVFDIKSGKALAGTMVHSAANRLLFSKDSKRLVTYKYTYGDFIPNSGAKEHTLKIWDLKEGSLITETVPYKNSFSTVCFSNDDKSLLITSPGSSARLFSVDNLKKQIVSVAPSTYFPHGEMTPDDKYIVTIFENQIRVSDAEDGYLKYEPIEFPDAVFKATLSPDGKFIAAFNLVEGKEKSQVRFYDLETGNEIFSPIFSNCKLYDAHISNCNRYIILEGDVNQKWDITTGKPASVPEPYSKLRLKASFKQNSNEFIVLKNNILYLDRFVTLQEILDHYRNTR